MIRSAEMSTRVRRLMATVGGLQGLALWALVERWPDSPHLAAVFTALVYFVTVSALVGHMARTGRHRARLLALAGGTGLAFGLVALWVGWQLPPVGASYAGDDARVVTWVCAGAIALYALGPFLQIGHATGRARFPYPELYRHSWNNFFIALMGVLYASALWTVLVLWGQLFALVGIDVFEDFFSEKIVVCTVSGAALGYGLCAGRENERVIATLRGLTQGLFRAVLPILAGVSIAFLATLPFTGLAPLFATSHTASILMTWLVFGVLFFNAVYLDGSARPPYSRWMRRATEVGMLALPALGAIGLYALALRIGQHGLTPQRMWGLVIGGVLTLYVLGYAVAVALRGEPWLPRVQSVNRGMAWLLVGLAFALHTPAGDPLAWSLRSQLARLESGATAPEDFDYGYLRFELGHRGFAALELLAAELPAGESATGRRIQNALEVVSFWDWKQQTGIQLDAKELALWPPERIWPAGLRLAIERAASEDWELQRCRRDATCLVFATDLDGDGTPEQIVAVGSISFRKLVVLQPKGRDDDWERVAVLRSESFVRGEEGLSAWIAAIQVGRFRVTPAPYGDLEVDGDPLRLDPF